MKLENFSDLYFVAAVFVPGFIYTGVVANFIPARSAKEKDLLFLRYLTATAFNYAICSPLIYLLGYGVIFTNRPVAQAFTWFAILFVVPVILAMGRAWIIQKDSLGWFYRLIELRPINPNPTGWDWIFTRIDPCFVLITLNDGGVIAGFFGAQSMASSDTERRDIYIEQVCEVPEDGGPWQPLEKSLGIHIDAAKIAYIEFRR